MAPINSNFKIHQTNTKAQTNPTVTATSDGGFIVAWEQLESYGLDIFLKKYNSQLNPASGEIRLDDGISNHKYSPKLAGDTNGNLLITWLQDDGGPYNIYVRKFQNDLSPLTISYQIDVDALGIQWFPEIATSPSDGSSLIVWEDLREGNSDIYGQRIRSDGTKRASNFRLNEVIDFSTQWRPKVCAGANGFITVWEDERDSPNAIYSQWLNSSLLFDGGNIRIDNPIYNVVKSLPDVTVNENGASVFCWQENVEGSKNVLNTALLSSNKSVNGYNTITPLDYNGSQTNVAIDNNNNFGYFFWLDKPEDQKWQDAKGKHIAFESLPVELTLFNAKKHPRYIELNWQTASESNNSGFVVLRKFGNGDFQKVTFINGQGTKNSHSSYSWQDNDVSEPGTYLYQLQQIDFDGDSQYFDIIEITVRTPEDFILYQNYPNPFNGSTTIGFDIPYESKTILDIFNLSGQKVKSLVNRPLNAGQHSINWDGRNDEGILVPSGLYVASFETPQFKSQRTLLFLR